MTKPPRTKLDLPDHIKLGLDLPDITGYRLESEHPFYHIVTPHGNLSCRHCANCNRIRLLLEFYPKKIICKDCHKFKVRKWQKKNADKVASYKKLYNKKYHARVKAAAAHHSRHSNFATSSPNSVSKRLRTSIRPQRKSKETG